MRLNTAKYHLRAAGRRSIYTAIDGTESVIRAKIEDADVEVRMAESMEMITHDATGFVASDLDPARGATLTQNGNVYRIDGIRDAKSPGLVELDLARISGDGLERWDFSKGVRLLTSETIEWEGVEIRAHVNRQGVHFEDQGYGVPVETVRTVALIRASDAPAIAAGDFIAMGGEDRMVEAVKRTGANTLRVVVV
jgi:hypothetical protein